jgi:conjugal transfer pilus assembly protein TraI
MRGQELPRQRKLSSSGSFPGTCASSHKPNIAGVRLRDWIRPAPTEATRVAGADAASIDDSEIPRYPPFLRGLPVAPPERVVATQRELIARLQDGLAFTDARFHSLVVLVVRRYAAFVHLLPASEAHHHRGAGGLFRHGLEVAFHAAQASQGMILALDRSPGERRELEPRWRLAAGLAGLCHDLGKPVSDLSVSDRDGQTTWRPLLESLTDWAAANGVAHYFLRWRERRHRRHETFGLLVLERILIPEVTAWLADPDPEIMQGLLAAVAGIDDGAVLGRLVSEADRASVERDLRENHIDPATISLGVPVDRYLLDAMRRLVRGGRWQINVPGARLWLLPDGLHLVWPAGAEEVVSLLAADRVPGIPRDPDTLAEILLERALVVPRQEGDTAQRYWRIAPEPLARDGKVITLSTLRLASPDLVIAGAVPTPVGVIAEDIASRTPAPPDMATAEAADPKRRAASTPTDPRTTDSQTPSPIPTKPNSERSVVQSGSVGSTLKARTASAVDGKAGARDDTRGGDDAGHTEGWFRSRGPGGEHLLSLARGLENDEAAVKERVLIVNEQVLVRFPEGLAGLGSPPQAQLEALAGSGLLETDPLAPLRRVRVIDGVRGALLTLDASRQVLAIIGLARPSQSFLPTSIETDIAPDASRVESAPPAETRAPNKETQRRRKKDDGHDAGAAARELVARIRARDAALPGGVSVADGCLRVGPEVPTWFVGERPGLNRYALLRALGQIAGCRVGADGGISLSNGS